MTVQGGEPVTQQKGISLKENIQLTALGFGLLIVGFNLFFGSIKAQHIDKRHKATFGIRKAVPKVVLERQNTVENVAL